MAGATYHRIRVWRAGAAAIAMAMLLLSGCATRDRAICLANANSGNWSLQGTLITPDAVIPQGVITIAGKRIAAIKAVGREEFPSCSTRIDGIILPGLIDLHNHLTFNVFRRWHPPKQYSNREEWRLSADHQESVGLQYKHLVKTGGLGCEANLYGEVKALVGGATSAVGSLRKDCINGLVRNLDYESQFPATLRLFHPIGRRWRTPINRCARFGPSIAVLAVNEVFPLGGKSPDGDIPKISDGRARYLICNLITGKLRSLLVHLAEGTDEPSQDEFDQLVDMGLVREGLIIVHGTALGPKEFGAMASSGVGLVWSPRSNIELYGATLNIPAAQNAKVSIAIAPDWSITGSDGMLQELNYARANFSDFNAEQLTSMATSIPAKLARIEDRIGQLKPGLYADLLVIRRNEGSAYDSVVTASPADVQLVVVAGRPIYGDSTLMQQLMPGKQLTLIAICGASKAIDLDETIAAQSSWEDVKTSLQDRLSPAILGTVECPASPSDLLGRPTPDLDSIPEIIPAPGPGPVEKDTDSLQPG